MKPLNKYIDHTQLSPTATRKDIITLCEEAMEYDFYSVCVHGCHVKLASEKLKGSSVLTAAVVGFPLGAMATEVKAYETKKACQDGALEIDMVINIGALKEGLRDYVLEDIRSVVREAKAFDSKVKVILETCLLSKEEIVLGCQLALEAKADFVKTSTGFSTEGASLTAVSLMRTTVGEAMGVKASGGIRSKEAALSMINAGASRLGTSASIEIIKKQ